jgi:hypothetical protein
MRRLFCEPNEIEMEQDSIEFYGFSLARHCAKNLGITHTSWHFFVADLDTTRVTSTHHFVRGVSVDGRKRSV